MATPSPSNNSGCLKLLLFLFVGPLALGLLWLGGCLLAVNLFIGLDNSVFARLGSVGGGDGGAAWPGYVLLGAGLGAAAGAVAAQQRYRLSRGLLGGVAALGLMLGAGALVGNTARLPSSEAATDEAGPYTAAPGRGQCPACATAEASSTKTDPQNRYTAAQLLDKDPDTAWIAADGQTSGQTLRLRLRIPTDQQLVGLRLTNGYAKSREVYRSFARVRAGRLSLDGGPETTFTLPDAREPDRFIPLRPVPGSAPAEIVLRLTATYPGTNHAEPALSGLVPVIAPRP